LFAFILLLVLKYKPPHMQITAIELQTLIDQHRSKLRALPENKMNIKSDPSKWSKKEILGHLVDSAQNNIRRFVVAQYEDNPKIVYNQDKWVAIADYQHYELDDLKKLWYLLNNHLCTILRSLPAGIEKRNCQTESIHTLEWLAQDYVKHLRHHIHQILDLEPVAYP
jgi:hypothetical protein